MKLVICGSMDFHREYARLKNKLKDYGHQVFIPFSDEVYSRLNKTKRDAMEDFNENLEKSDAILVANYKKNDKEDYIGINSVMEIGMAFNKKKKIFVLNKFPEDCREELEAIVAVELNSDLSKIA